RASCLDLARGEARPDHPPSMSEDTLRGVGSGREAPGSRSPRTTVGAAEERTGDESVEVKAYDAAVPATYMVRNTAEGREGQGHLCVLQVRRVVEHTSELQ